MQILTGPKFSHLKSRPGTSIKSRFGSRPGTSRPFASPRLGTAKNLTELSNPFRNTEFCPNYFGPEPKFLTSLIPDGAELPFRFLHHVLTF